MKRGVLITVGIIVVLALIYLSMSVFIVDQTKQAVVLRFGKIVKVIKDPGIHFKQPFVDNVVIFEKRILLYDIEPEKIITADKKTLVVDTYALWRIEDPEVFLKSMRSVTLAQTRIDDVVYSHIRDVFAKGTFEDVVTYKREEFLRKVTELCRKDLRPFGIEIVDVRIKHADFPKENVQAVYNRMRTERYSIAAKIRAEGEKEAQIIKANADKKAKIILAEAQKTAEIVKGTGEASALKVYAEAFSKDPDFYTFWKEMELYSESLKDSIFILGKDATVLELMR